jgi:hypothetical protein
VIIVVGHRDRYSSKVVMPLSELFDSSILFYHVIADRYTLSICIIIRNSSKITTVKLAGDDVQLQYVVTRA